MIEIRTLGQTYVLVDGEPLTGEAAWPKSLALIIYMAREPGPDRREEILGVLWPDREEKRARRALNQLLYTLRKTSPKLDLESVEDAIDFGREVWLDVEEFERRIETGDLEGAVDLYRGPFLADLSIGELEFDHWADRERENLKKKFRKVALELATGAREVGDHERAVGFCRRLIEADPLDDEAQHLLIECLYLRGDRVGALRQYDLYRDILARELEVEPLDHTLELVSRIRGERGPTEAAQAATPSPAAPDTSEDRSRPEAESTAVGGQPTTPTAERREAVVESRPGRVWRLSLAGLAVVAVVTVAVTAAIRLWPRTDTQDLASSAGPAGLPGLERIAVLPFVWHGTDASGVGDGSGEGIAQLLAVDMDSLGPLESVDHRDVMERWAGGPGRDAAPSVGRVRSLAADFGATAVVQGDVHVNGEQVRLIARVTDPVTGSTLAQADVDGSRATLFSLVDDLALELLEGLWEADSVVGDVEAIAREAGSMDALKAHLWGAIHESRGAVPEAYSAYLDASSEAPGFRTAVRSLIRAALRLSGEAEDRAGRQAEALVGGMRGPAAAARGAERLATLEFARGRPESGYRWLEQAEVRGLASDEIRAWRGIVYVVGLGLEMPDRFQLPATPPTGRAARRDWVRDTWLSGSLALRNGDRASAVSAVDRLAGAVDGTPGGSLAERLAAGLQAELALAAGDSVEGVVALRRAAPAETEPTAAWADLSVYRFQLAMLELERGEEGEALERLRSFDGGTLGELLLHGRAQLARGRAAEAIGRVEEADSAYSAAAWWWTDAEPRFREYRTRAAEGRARVSGEGERGRSGE